MSASRHDDLQPPILAVAPRWRFALAEDTLPIGDLTASLVPRDRSGAAQFVARRPGVVAGTACAQEVCAAIDPSLLLTLALEDGDDVAAGGVIGEVSGPFRSILTAERTALNFLSHLSGVATLTRRYVDLASAANPAARVWDTRKTTPGLRALEKAAVRAGGGVNHRGSLSEGVLVKDNHLGEITIEEAVATALERWPGRMLEVECDRLEDIERVVLAGATLVLCDNMSPDEVREAVAIVDRHRAAGSSVLVEASGGVNLDTIGAYAAAGADVISVGALTHSAPILDIGLDLEAEELDKPGLSSSLRSTRPTPCSGDRRRQHPDGDRCLRPTLRCRNAAVDAPKGEIAGLAHHWRVSTAPERTADELALLLKELLALDGLVLPRRDPATWRSGGSTPGALASSEWVASRSPPRSRSSPAALREMAGRWLDCPLVVVEPGVRTGIPIRFDNPREVGADRIANAVAALDLFGAPSIVVDLGTATTFDAISAAGEYLGGVIVPGLEISMDALFAHAAALRRVELVAPRHVIGRSTVESMQSGAIYGQAALVEGLCARISAEIGPARVIVTGGFGPVVAPQLSGPVYLEPWLTLHGLRLLYERNVDVTSSPMSGDKR